VDVGAGEGTFLPLLSPLYERVFALDRSRARLARCAARTSLGLGTLDFCHILGGAVGRVAASATAYASAPPSAPMRTCAALAARSTAPAGACRASTWLADAAAASAALRMRYELIK
jgi:hypothetical protein